MRRSWAVPLLMLLAATGCARIHTVRLDTGRGRTLEYAPPTWDRSVRVDADAFEASLSQLVLHLPLSLRPWQAGRLVRASSHGATMDGVWQGALRRDYGRWCGAHESPSDCLSLLEDGLGLDEMDRLTTALALAYEPMRQSIADAVEDTLSPQFFSAVVMTSLASWVALAAAPEPVFTKAAAVLSAVLLVYLGEEAFLKLVRACFVFEEATNRATTFQELDEAGERFGRVLGVEGARIFVLAVTVLVSHGTSQGAAWLASRLALLPNFAEAAALGASQVGLRLENVGQVSVVAVAQSGLAITLAPTAVAMTAMGPGNPSAGAQGLPSGGPGKWVQVNESMSESARDFQAQTTGTPRGYTYRVKGGGAEADFDGFDPQDGVLLEAKGPGYEQFIEDGLTPKKFFRGVDPLIEQAQRQFRVARGMPIRWLVAEKKFADELRLLFENRGVEIEVLHVPPAP